MKNFWKLCKIAIRNIFLGTGKNGKSKKRKSIAIIYAFLFVYLTGYFVYMFLSLASALTITGDFSPILSYASVISSIFVILFSVTTSANVLYKSNDNEMLIAMPLKRWEIVGSKIFSILVFAYITQFVCLLPSVIIYYIYAGFTITSFSVFLIGFLLFPLIPASIAILISIPLVILMSRSKRKNLLNIIGMFLFSGVLLYLITALNIYGNSDLGVGGVTAYANYLVGVKWFVDAVAGINFFSFAIFFVVSAILSIVTFVIVERTFIKVYSISKVNRSAKVRTNMKRQSQIQTLVRKEFKRFIGTPILLFNSGFALIMIVALTIYLSVKQFDLSFLLILGKNMEGIIVAILTLAICSIGSMCNTACVSISLEGNKIDVLRSFPLDEKKIVFSKTAFNILLVSPLSITSAIVLGIVYHISFVSILLSALTIFAFNISSSLYGIWINLKFPKMDAINDTVIVKQSLSSFLGMLVPMFLPVIFLSVYISVFADKFSGVLLVVFLLTLSAVSAVGFALYLIKNAKKLIGKL